MPVIDNYPQRKMAEKFKKKAYRSWDDVDQNADVTQETDEHHEVQTGRTIIKNNISNVFNDDKAENRTSNLRDFAQIKTLETTQQKNPIKHEITETSSIERVAFALRGLRSVQRQLVFFIADLCITRRQLSSGPIDQEMLIEACQKNINIIKNAIERLIKKGFLVREAGKKGYGGFSSFLISETLKNVIVQELQQPRLDKKTGGQFTPSYSEETSPSKITKNSLPEEWASIDFFPLENIHFSINHIEQLYKQNKLTAQQVQESLYAFDFDLKENDKGKSLRVGPLNYFMGILKNGMPYAPPQNYENPLEKALKSYISSNESRVQKQQELEKKALEIAFNEWEKKLSDVDVLSICESNSFANDPNSMLRKGALISYFQKQIWPEIKTTLLVEQTQ
jgi:hypothetical protein